MKILTAEQTAHALPYPALVDAMDQVFAGELTVPVRHHHTLPREGEADATLLIMPVWNAQFGCVKLVNVTPGNRQRSLPTIAASVLVFDGVSGQHVGLIDGATLTARRTAAASALGARHLARPDAETLLVVGAGRVGAELPAAFAAVRPIRQVLVWNRHPEPAHQLVEALQAQGITAKAHTELETAVKQADIISCATLATEPLIHGEWLQPGQHLDLLGAFTPQMREADDLALQRSNLYIDSEACVAEAGEIAIPLACGAIRREDILGTLADLCRDTERREARSRDPQAITCFKSAGNAAMDLAAASLAMQVGTH
ncbi:MAG: ornithine cyclodeaminase family protein [Thiolinea sp.]